MAESFEDLGITPELVAGAEDMGWDAPSALQRDAIPVLRRGNNAVLRASTGAGVTGAWGLAVLDRLAGFDDDASPLALVLTPSVDEASRAADALARIGATAGVTVRALAPGWTDRPARILVATAPAAIAAVRDSSLKLDALAILVLAGADRIQELDGWGAVETLTESVTGAGQRIVVTGAADRVLQEYLDRHVRKALSMPARPAEGGTPDTTGSLRYAVATDTAKLDALVAVLPSAGGTEVAVICRNRDRAEDLAAGLAARGIAVEGVATADAPRILVLSAAEADQRTTRASVVSCDVPFDSDALTALHSGGGTVIVTPSEVPHLRRIAAQAALRLQPMALPDHHAADQAEAARAAVREAVGEADLAAYLSLLRPLLEEHPAAEVAAAALYLARNAGAARPGRGAGASAVGSAERGSGQLRSTGSGAPPPSTSYVRLFVSVGSRDDVNPGDLVGAITGEAGVAGETVGRIDIRESHSTVEVASADAARVIEALNGRTLKGRSVRVDYDRKDRPGSGGEGGGRSGPREGQGPQSRRKSGGGSRGGGPKGGPRGPRGGKTGGKTAGRPGGRPSGRPSGGRSSGPGTGGSRK
ncbi:MAG TPA: DEAD/DEAH box helicase [Longimicrobiales bacterium]|nr:DEAD/DEAH box helicase [Longimicrobiales bacterium]